MRLLTALLSQNTRFESEKVIERLQSILPTKMLEMHPSGVKKVFAYLLDLALNKVDAHLRVDPTSPHHATPKLERVEMLMLPLRLLKDVPAEQGAYFLDMLILVL